MKRKYLQADLARDLGVSAALVSRYAKRGMPTYSPEAANRWLDSHLAPWLRKDVRQPALRAPQTFVAGDMVDSVAAVQLVNGFAELATNDFERWAEQLRGAMRAVPASARGAVAIELDVWDKLCAPSFKVLGWDGPPAAAGADTGAMNDEEADYVGSVLYGLACGELVARSDLDAAS